MSEKIDFHSGEITINVTSIGKPGNDINFISNNIMKIYLKQKHILYIYARVITQQYVNRTLLIVATCIMNVLAMKTSLQRRFHDAA